MAETYMISDVKAVAMTAFLPEIPFLKKYIKHSSSIAFFVLIIFIVIVN